MSARRLVLLRHGRTASNAENRFQGHLDVELDDVGLAQAAVAATYLGELLADAAARGAVRVVSSDLSRARQTAEPLAKALAIQRTDADVLYALATAYVDAGQPKDAIKPLNLAVALVPTGWAEPYALLQSAYTGAGDTARAEWAWYRAPARSPTKRSGS